MVETAIEREAPAAEGSPPGGRRGYRLPFKWWLDEDTKNFLVKQPAMADPENCFRLLSWTAPDGFSYLLNNTNRKHFEAQGPFKAPYLHADQLYRTHPGEDAYVLCPGPSLAEADMEALRGRLTIAVNSAGFATPFAPTLWAVFESNYMLEVLRHQQIPAGRSFLFSARVAVRWRGNGYTPKAPKATYWVARFEEERLMPHRTPAVATMGAIAGAYWLGARRCWLLGMDLSRPGGQPYVKGVPYGQGGATSKIEEQLKALIQVRYPGMEILNCSPHSREKLREAFTPATYAEAAAAAREASP